MSESGDRGRSHAFRSGVLAMLPVLIGIAPFAAVVGLAGTQNGFSVVETTAFTVLAYTGAAQVAALDLIGQGASVTVVLVTAFVMNLRFIVYSASVAPIFVEAGFTRRLLGSYLLVDHVVALASTRTKGMALRDAVAFYFGACLVFWGVWQVCALAGSFAGSLPNTGVVAFAVPISFLALLAPQLRDRPRIFAAVVAAVVAVMCAELPANLGMMLGAAAGILTGVALGWRAAGEESAP